MTLVARSMSAAFASVFVLCGIACTTEKESTATRVDLEAFSVEMPTSPGWMRKISSSHVSLGRSLGSKFHTFSLDAREYPPAPMPVQSISEVLIGVRNAANKEANTKGRFELMSHFEAISTRSKIGCVEYQKSWKDHGGAATQHSELAMTTHGLVCVHPRFANRLIEISYSARNDTGTAPHEAKSEGEAFISSLQARTLEHINSK
jgi:hypothetical protein